MTVGAVQEYLDGDIEDVSCPAKHCGAQKLYPEAESPPKKSASLGNAGEEDWHTVRAQSDQV